MPFPLNASETNLPEPLFRLQHYTITAPLLPVLRTATAGPSQPKSPLPHAYILVSGLGDTLGTLPYIPRLANVLQSRSRSGDESSPGPGWELLLPTLSSTGGGWGTASLEGDARELSELIHFLRQEEVDRFPDPSSRPHRHIVIHGHSTGCQDLVQWLSETRTAPNGVPLSSLPAQMQDSASILTISAAIFQAPVSDVEDFVLRVVPAAQRNPTLKRSVDMLELSKKMIADGKGHCLLPREHVAVLTPEHGPPAWSLPSSVAQDKTVPPPPTASDPVANGAVTAYRHHSLHEPLGDDDFFSSPRLISDENLRKGRLARAISKAEESDTKLLFLFSAEDQYVHEDLRKDEATIGRNFLNRWASLQSDKGKELGTYTAQIVPGADHGIHDEDAQIKMLQLVTGLLDRLESA
ncbi:hypothetical protein OC846_002928 [Tilletia horrida]|uniref:Uncharacterized protein n=1 Tax=Tilletia horrida TaxID=155126 RepID=A0AAN6GR30_9BASI|nr:hypothetical protein OC846_002928 [Tilletia horrida]KAK0552989.1 hypothetical protein OC845_001408 [Tilletia horrida]KAK0566891.1 hypothetical protein OC861_003013 [Tilletia horrida]